MDKSNIDQYYIQLNIVEEKLEELDKERANQLLDQACKAKMVFSKRKINVKRRKVRRCSYGISFG